jgi:DNA-binding beta-propeller fold protein YncE
VSRRQIVCLAVCMGVLAAPATALGSGWVYTESNNPASGKNSVLALDYGTTGRLNPAHIREYYTKGTGAALIQPGLSVGTLGADQQVTLSPDHKFLYAVNQGSGTVAVFKVNKKTGALKHVKGSPFDSGGNAPISVGAHGKRVVVANHGVVAPFNPASPPPGFGNPNFTSFKVSKKGKLTKISSVPAGPGPTQALISPSGRNVFSTSFYGFFGPANQTIQSLKLSKSGKLSEAAGSPTGLPPAVTNAHPPLPPFLPPGIEKLAFGIATHPNRKIAYILGAVDFQVAIYRYNKAGALTFLGGAANPGALAACWVVLTSDGRFMYTANTATQNISVLSVSDDGTKADQVQVAPIPSTGTDLNLAIDPTDNYLYAVAAHDDPDGPRPQGVKPDGTIMPAPADGNFLEAYKILGNGKLASIGTTALPVKLSQEPYGLAILRKAVTEAPKVRSRRWGK